ncbi:hypothetical protein D5018_16800 [Parashewanella curva]|uniref:Uncharacterized protein n=1 Tax=Parashewanella curva TaxID=2338552 RepID=A0A3L8PWY3_9GAMM|nr:hypothetical protein [Parashewanella curva]RLV58552.1 hypothetical protein D5018_16800 [Parashewanella curva]
MGNRLKRQKRAKQKAKMSRVQKQHQLEFRSKLNDISYISPELEFIFEGLVEHGDNLYSLVPQMKLFVSKGGESGHNLIYSTAMMFSLYMWWKHYSSDVVYIPTVDSLADGLVHQPEFLKYFD